MNYQIVLSKEIGISEEEFYKEWNSNELCIDTALAQLKRAHPTRSFELSQEILLTLTPIGVGVASASIYELIKWLIKKRFGIETEVQSEKIEKHIVIIIEKAEDITINL